MSKIMESSANYHSPSREHLSVDLEGGSSAREGVIGSFLVLKQVRHGGSKTGESHL